MISKNLKSLLVFVACGLMIMLINIDLTVTNLAVPSIAKSLNADLNQTQWIIAAYLLATAAFLTLFGKLADDFGKKRIFLFGVIVFSLASLLAGLTHHLHVLIFARFIQGLGFAATLGLSLIIIVESFPAEKKGYITGLAVTISGLSQALGPIIGGIILHSFSWNWIFLLNLPFSLVAFVLGLLVIKPDRGISKLNKVNIVNASSFILGICLILYLLNQITVLLNDIYFIVTLLIAISLLVGVFIHTSLKSTKPLIDFALLTNNCYVKMLLIRFIFMTAMASLLFVIPIYLENIIGLTPLYIGKMMLFMTLMVALLAPLTGKVLDRVGFVYPVLVSLISIVFALLIMLTYRETISLAMLSIGLFLFGTAIGIHTPASINAALSSVPKQKSGVAIGLFYTVATSGAVIGVAICGSIINIVSQYYIESRTPHLMQQTRDTVIGVAKGVGSAANLDQIPELKLIAQQAFLYAFHRFLWVELLIFVVAVLLCLTLMNQYYANNEI